MQYLVSVIDDGQAAAAQSPDSATQDEMAAIDAFNDRLRADGHWVFAGGLGLPAAAAVIDNRGARAVVTDGPFTESREYAAGFWILDAPDRDTAMRLATEASKACNRKLEVRQIDQAP